ncbi:MAG: hypothetical protein L0H73_04175 [Nitrococcus sp.]|nr:hypothetical protein [Nitrococcus sp.]
MIPDPKQKHRFEFLVRVIRREREHLARTDARLFVEPFIAQRAQRLDEHIDEAERVDAFVSRFGRLQDTLGDKLLPVYLEALGEKAGGVIDDLDRAERLGLIPSADDWFTIRKLRNQMVHEYIEDPAILASALQTGHEFVPILFQVADTLLAALEKRGWLSEK